MVVPFYLGNDMQSIFYVNSIGELIIPSKEVLLSSLGPIRALPILFPHNWPVELIDDACEMPVIENLGSNEIPGVRDSRAVVCRSKNLWKKFLRSDSVVINGVALKCWAKEYQASFRPTNSLVFITEGVKDPSGDGFNLAEMEMKRNPIVFVEIGV